MGAVDEGEEPGPPPGAGRPGSRLFPLRGPELGALRGLPVGARGRGRGQVRPREDPPRPPPPFPSESAAAAAAPAPAPLTLARARRAACHRVYVTLRCSGRGGPGRAGGAGLSDNGKL